MNRIRRIALQLIERYPNLFTTDFEKNKELLNSIAIFRSKELRNKVAGYITDHMRDLLIEEKKEQEQEVSAEI